MLKFLEVCLLFRGHALRIIEVLIQHREAFRCVESEKELMSIDSSVGAAEHSITFFVSERPYPYSRDTVKVCKFIISYLTIENFVDLLLLREQLQVPVWRKR